MISLGNKKAEVGYYDFVKFLSENAPESKARPSAIGFIEALYYFDMVTDEEYDKLSDEIMGNEK
jgi:hypothetical protein